MLAEMGVLFGTMVVAMCLGVPVFLSLGISAAAYVVAFWPKVPLMVIAQGFVQGLGSYDLVAIPFFFLAGEYMTAGGISTRLLRFANSCLGHIRGGLSHVNVLASMIFAGVSGSALADASAVGSVMAPAMKKQGYSGAYAAAVTACASTIGPIIPPSIPMVLFGMFASVSVGKLFVAGVVPGLLMGVFLMVAASIIAHHRGYPKNAWAGWRELAQSFASSWSALAMPLIVVAGVLGGVTTVTEVAAIAAVYALAVSLSYREASLRVLWTCTVRAAVDACKVLVILSIAGLFIWIIGNMGLGKLVSSTLLSITRDPTVLLLMIALFYVIAGTALEPVVLFMVFVPLTLPAAREIGVDMIQLGVVSVLSVLLGLLTPPVGMLLFICSSQAGARVSDVVRECVPFFGALVLLLLAVIFFPQISLWLPSLMR